MLLVGLITKLHITCTCTLHFFQIERSVSPLDAYETGPLLLVTPTTDGEAEGGGNGGEGCDSRELSCDALFLWRPEAINANIFVKLKNDGLRVVDDCGE